MNRYFKNTKLKGTRLLDMHAHGTEGKEAELNVTYWAKNDTYPESQIEIWTARGGSFVIKGPEVEALLAWFGGLMSVDKGLISTHDFIQIREIDSKNLPKQTSGRKRAFSKRAGSSTHAGAETESDARGTDDPEGPRS